MGSKKRQAVKSLGGVAYATLFRQAPEAQVIFRAADLVVLDVNAAFAELVGRARARMVGLAMPELDFWPEPGWWQSLGGTLEAGSQAILRETSLQHRDGRVVPVRLTLRRIVAGRRKDWLATFQTVQKEFAPSTRDYAEMIRVLGEGAGIVDDQERFVFANSAAEIIFGVQPGQLVGRPLTDFLAPDQLAKIQEETTHRRAGQQSTYGITILRLDGTPRYLQVTVLPLDDPNGRYIGGFGFFHDVTEHRHAEDALRESEMRYRYFVEKTTEGFYRLEADGPIPIDQPVNEIIQLMYRHLYIAESNDAFARMYGYDYAGKIAGVRFVELHGGNDIPKNLETLGDFVRSNYQMLNAETRELDKDGNEIIFANNSIGIIKNGLLVSTWGTQVDITARKRVEEALRENEERFRLVLDGSQLGFWDWDIENGEVRRNERWASMLGYTMEEIPLTVSHRTDLIHPDDRQRAQESLEDHLANRTPIHWCEYRMRAKDGHYRWILDRACVMRRDAQGKPLRMCGTHTDITERKLAEVELQRYREQLEELVAQRTAELAEARDLAQSANYAKSAFLANMSHELRTPLTAVLGFAEIVSRNPDIPGSAQENLGIIIRSGEHLLALINDILDLSKIEAGRIEVDPHDVDLGELISDIISMMRGRAEARGVQLVLDQASEFPRFVNTDPGKFRQILVNLVGNAIKFTVAGHVTIKLAAEPHPAGHVLKVEVRDTGIGISHGDLERIFRPFEQIGTTMTEGTGLGLTITRQYVQMLGGRISVDSELGKGSCFSFTIQAGQASLDSIQAPPASCHPVGVDNAMAADIRILIVEDQPENRLLLRCFLEPLNFQIREAVNGQEAVSIFQGWRPQLVFMDRRMPVLDGLEATRQIKALPGGSETVVIAVSAHSFKEEQREMLDAGCNDFLGKPFGMADLLVLMKKHLHLNLVYANREDSSPVISKTLSLDDLRILSPDSLNTLWRLTNECDDAKLAKWLESSACLSPAARMALAALIKDYRFDVILEIVEPLLPPDRA